MNRPLIIACLILLSSKICVAQSAGILTFEKQFHNFGDITEGQTIQHNFSFKNTGIAPIHIDKVNASCGCTVATLEKHTYAPNEQGTLNVNVDTRDKAGMMNKKITLYLDQGTPKKITLSLFANIKPAPHPNKKNHQPVTLDPACKSCHLTPNKDLQGKALYDTLCLFCHQKNAEDILTQQTEGLDYVIRNGLIGTAMPPYQTNVSPALTETQIQSLIHYLLKQSP
jgi:cytochrome c5